MLSDWDRFYRAKYALSSGGLLTSDSKIVVAKSFKEAFRLAVAQERSVAEAFQSQHPDQGAFDAELIDLQEEGE